VGASLSFVAGFSGSSRLQRLAARAGPPTVTDVQEAEATAATGALKDAKERLMDLLEDSSLEEEVLRPEGKPMRGRVDEAIIRLERLNTNEEPVYSVDMDGTWMVKYTGSYAPGLLSSPTRELALFLYGGGFSLGNALSSFAQGFWGQTAGVKLGSKTVQITGGRDVEASAEVEVAGRKETLNYKARKRERERDRDRRRGSGLDAAWAPHLVKRDPRLAAFVFNATQIRQSRRAQTRGACAESRVSDN